jgi:hypothetical protein
MGLSLFNLGEDLSNIATRLRSWHFTDELIDDVMTWLDRRNTTT